MAKSMGKTGERAISSMVGMRVEQRAHSFTDNVAGGSRKEEENPIELVRSLGNPSSLGHPANDPLRLGPAHQSRQTLVRV